MNSLERNLVLAGALILIAIRPELASSQPNSPSNKIDHPSRVSIEYVQPEQPTFQELYNLLRERRVLESLQDILSPLRLPEELTIKITECHEINAWYRREQSNPTVTICYEFLKHILDSLPDELGPTGLTRADAAVGQFFWTSLHEVGHAVFDIFNIPVFGHPEDAADNFATYVLLQFGEGQAHRLIGGAAWAWRAYLGDYKRNPVMPMRLSAFADDHGLPQERFYNLICLAIGADPVGFADFEEYLPAFRSAHCAFEYRTVVHAFKSEITPHIDQDVAKRVLETNWLQAIESQSVPQK